MGKRTSSSNLYVFVAGKVKEELEREIEARTAELDLTVDSGEPLRETRT